VGSVKGVRLIELFGGMCSVAGLAGCICLLLGSLCLLLLVLV
jgi:hypothetical protein